MNEDFEQGKHVISFINFKSKTTNKMNNEENFAKNSIEFVNYAT